jgi:hypothetical protein
LTTTHVQTLNIKNIHKQFVVLSIFLFWLFVVGLVDEGSVTPPRIAFTERCTGQIVLGACAVVT